MTVYLFMAAMLLKNPITLEPQLIKVSTHFNKQSSCERAGYLAHLYGYVEEDWTCTKVKWIE